LVFLTFRFYESGRKRSITSACLENLSQLDKKALAEWEKAENTVGIDFDQRVRHLESCRSILGRISPYNQLGIDPGLAEAIIEYRIAKIALVDSIIGEYKAFIPALARNSSKTQELRR